MLEPRRRIERALGAVIQEAWGNGVSSRKVDDPVQAMGGCNGSKGGVSRICQELDQELALFRERPLDDARYPCIWFDATLEKVREGGRIVSQAAVVAIGVRETGEKWVLEAGLGPCETEAFWLEFCRSLLSRGLQGVQLVISDAHLGLTAALGQLAALHRPRPGQRCRRLLPPGGTRAAGAGEDGLRPAEPEGGGRGDLPGAAATRAEAPQGGPAAAGGGGGDPLLPRLPPEHWRSIGSTNTLERPNAELDRRAKVVGISPTQVVC